MLLFLAFGSWRWEGCNAVPLRPLPQEFLAVGCPEEAGLLPGCLSLPFPSTSPHFQVSFLHKEILVRGLLLWVKS